MPAVATWPSSLPALPRQAGFAYTKGTNVIRSEMDTGPPKVRRRATASVDRFSVSLALTAAQEEVLRTFFESMLADGSLSFTWTHPLTGASREMRFTTPLATSRDGTAWVVDFEVEVLP